MRTKEITIKERLTRSELCDFIHDKAIEYLDEVMSDLYYGEDIDLLDDVEMAFYTPSEGEIFIVMDNYGGGRVYVATRYRDGEDNFTNLKRLVAMALPTRDEWRAAKDAAYEGIDEGEWTGAESVNYWMHREMPAFYLR